VRLLPPVKTRNEKGMTAIIHILLDRVETPVYVLSITLTKGPTHFLTKHQSRLP